MNDGAVKATEVVSNSVVKSINKHIYLFIKRVFDILISLVGFIFLLPVTIIVKLMYMFKGDFKSIFYSQNRIGKDGREFKFYKFRTMVVNADEVLEKLLKEDKEKAKEYKIYKKLSNDPRITKVGKVLRKTSLDELPQIINIFLGDMSLIGNRPYLPREKKDMGEHFNKIVSTRPGLTGWWQVSGRSNTSFEERLKLEEYYSEHCGLRMDIKIFFKTFFVVLLRKGADK